MPLECESQANCRGLCLLTGADDRRHFMTAMSTPPTKSLPYSSAPVRATKDLCLSRPFWRSRNTGFSCQLRHFHRPVLSVPSAFPSARQTDCDSIPIGPGPAQFNEFYR
jgi:hypothetical protein